MNSRPNDNFSKMTIFQKKKNVDVDHFSKKAFGLMNFRSNDLSVDYHFQKKASGQMNIRSNEFSVKRPCAHFFFGQMTFFVESRFGQIKKMKKKYLMRKSGT
jgi:hypothetical protein